MMKSTDGVETKVKKKKKKFTLFIMLFLMAIAIILTLRTDIFSIQSVKVNGNDLLSDDYIVDFSGIIIGNNIFKEKTKNISENLLAHPYIKAAKIKRSFPDTLNINIEERKRAATISFMGNFIIIDREGYVLESSINAADLLVIKGLDILSFNEGDILKVDNKLKLDKTLKIINKLKDTDIAIMEIDISNIDDIRFKISKYMGCKIGDGENLNYKLDILQNILADLSKRDINRGIIDISGEGYPGYRPVE